MAVKENDKIACVPYFRNLSVSILLSLSASGDPAHRLEVFFSFREKRR